MRYRFTVSYDGTAYAGFQSQINALAIQDVIEGVLSSIFDEKVRIVMASRTDAGVHALHQVFHLDSDKQRDPDKLKYALNGQLPKDIHILECGLVSEDFHARFSVKRKTYRYIINLGEYDVFLNNRSYQCRYRLDIDLMREGAKLFLGRHDFGSFSTVDYSEMPDQHRTVFDLRLIEEGNLLILEIIGDGFLKNMVRIITGTLIDLGRGSKTLEDVRNMIDVPDKNVRRYNVTGSGLYLVNIEY